MPFKLHYHISNNRDGSASVCFHPTAEAAQEADEEMDEGWGEPSNCVIRLKVEDGKLFYQDYVEATGDFQWIEAIQDL